MRHLSRFLYTLFFAWAASFAHAQNNCYDANAIPFVYDDGWQTGDPAGFGFGSWTLARSGLAGHALGTSTLNGNGDSNGDGDIDTDGRAWRMSATNGGAAQAWLNFSFPLTVGLPFSLKMDNNNLGNGASAGFSLRNSQQQELMRFFYDGASARYRIFDALGNRSTNMPYTDEGMIVNVTLSSANQYTLTVTPLNAVPVTFTGSLLPAAAGQSITTLQLFLQHAVPNPTALCFFNEISLCGLPDCPLAAIAPLGQSACDPATNTFSQTLSIAFSAPPPQGATLTFNGTPLPINILNGSMTFTLDGLPADGSSFDANLVLSGSQSCSLSVPALFSAPADCQPPAITCPPAMTVSAQPASCGSTLSYAAPTLSDNLPGTTLIQTEGLPDGSFFPIGTTTNTFVATDAAGNTASCSFSVTVNDIPPVAGCQPATLYLDAAGSASLTVADINNASADNCAAPGLALDRSTFGCADQGSNTVTLTATDNTGLTASCTATVTVIDSIRPVISCRAFSLLILPGESYSLTPADAYDPASLSDNCGSPTAAFPPATVTTADNGTTVAVTVTATDAAGNTGSCQTLITVSAPDPDTVSWTQPNPGLFPFSANIIAQLRINGVAAHNPAHRIAFFDGSQLRALNNPVSVNGQTFHFFTLYDNQPAGTELTIRLFHADHQLVYDATTTFTFQQLTITGSLQQPFFIDVFTDGDLPPALDLLPAQRGMQGMSLAPLDLTPFLQQQDADPVRWEILPNPHFTAAFSGNSLQLSPIDPAWTGTASLSVVVTEISANAKADTASLSLQMLPAYLPPLFSDIPDQHILPGQAFSSFSLGDFEDNYTGDCLTFTATPLPVAQTPPAAPGWTQPAVLPNTMSIAAVANLTPYFTFGSPGDQMAVFIAGQLRGLGTLQLADGKPFFFFQVYHTAQTADMHIRLYSSQLGQVLTAPVTFSFSANDVLGSPNAPISIDFSPLGVSLDPLSGQVDLSLRDSSWTGALQLEFAATDCNFPATFTDTELAAFCIGPDADQDGICDLLDPDPANPCIPNRINGRCDFDGDGLFADVDPDDNNPCLPGVDASVISLQQPSCRDATDGSMTIALLTPLCSGGRFEVSLVDQAGSTIPVAANALLPDTLSVAALDTGRYQLRIQLTQPGSCLYSPGCFPLLIDSFAILRSADTTPPGISLQREGGISIMPGDTVRYDALSTSCTASANWLITLADNCAVGVPQASISPLGSSPQGSLTLLPVQNDFLLIINAPVGAHSISVTATDADGNTRQQTYLLRVTDTTPPNALCRNITAVLNPFGLATVSVTDIDAGSSDNCAILNSRILQSPTFDCSDIGQASLTLVVTDPAGLADSCTAAITITEGAGLLPGWTAAAVGQAQGDADYFNCQGRLVIESTGFVGGGVDALFTAGLQLCGDGQITARIQSVSEGWAGVQLRESNQPRARKIALRTNLLGFVRREMRSVANGQLFSQIFNVPNHSWLRLERIGDDFYGYASPNGVNWQNVFYQNLSLPQCLTASFYTESTTGDPAVAVFTDASVVNAIFLQGGGYAAHQAQEIVQPEVFPNPASGRINVRVGPDWEGGSAQLLNMLGQEVARLQVLTAQEVQEVALRGVAPGVYSLVLRVGARVHTMRVVVK